MFTRFVIPCVVLVALFSGVTADALTSETVLDALGMEKDARLVNLRCDRTNNVIALDDSRLYEDDAPATGVPEGYDYRGKEWKEDLVKGVVVRKLLIVDDPRAFGARLLFKGIEEKGNTEPLHISINGVGVIRPATIYAAPHAKQYAIAGLDRWFVIDIPTGALKEGANEILMWSESEKPSWRILIALEEEFKRGSLTRPHHPNRSMKSSDGGRTWSDTRLGAADSVDGEYSIRLSLDQHVPEGVFESPVFDIIDNSSVLKKKVDIGAIDFSFDIDAPEGTTAMVSVRFGNSPLGSDPSWTAWQTVGGGQRGTVNGDYRYMQWKAELSTSTPLETPSLRQFAVKADYETASPNDNLGLTVKVEKNGRVVRSSYPFGYEDLTHPELKKYRETFKLDKIIEGANTEFDVMMRLLHWAYRIPLTSDEYSWNWNDIPLLIADENGMPKLQMEYKGRRRDAMCLYSNQALVGALLSYGFQARHINIHSEAVSGHEVTEVWSNEFNKWIYMDATRDYYYFDPDTGVPLNELEIHNLLKEQVPRVETWQRPFMAELADSLGRRIRVGLREGNNPVSIVEHGTHIMEIMGHFRIIPRNNFLSEPLPVPVHTGATMWGWDGFLNWYDEKFPKRWEYQLQTDRPIDFYEPLNQSEVSLSETDRRGVLNVEVNTFTPGGFDTFLVRIDNGGWFEMKNPSWEWPITGGIHTLEVRIRNVRGVTGPISRLAVTYNP